jgi:hypothetical protein
MKLTILLHGISVGLALFTGIAYSSAQTSKVAIVSLADTTVVHQHVGMTIFANFTDTLHLDIAVKQCINGYLKKYLSNKYEVNIIDQLPDSVFSAGKGIFGDWTRLRKEVRKWLTGIKDQYDFVIFIDNISVPREMNLLIPDNTSGIYTRGKRAAFYTTITLVLYRTSDLQELEYYYLGGKFIKQIENFKIPEDKKTFTPEISLFLKDGMIKYLESRVEYFLSKTYLIPQNQIDEIKTNNL